MKREDLKKFELTDEVIDEIMALNGKSINQAKSAGEALSNENADLKKQLAEANGQIEKFGKLDIEAVKKEAAEWKANAEKAAQEAASKIYNYKFDKRLEQKLRDEFGVKNPKRLIHDLDREMLKYNEATDDIDGNLADQLKPIREAEAYLFNDPEAERTPRFSAKSNQSSAASTPFLQGFLSGAGIKDKQNGK